MLPNPNEVLNDNELYDVMEENSESSLTKEWEDGISILTTSIASTTTSSSCKQQKKKKKKKKKTSRASSPPLSDETEILDRAQESSPQTLQDTRDIATPAFGSRPHTPL
jgi:hypothetical protein